MQSLPDSVLYVLETCRQRAEVTMESPSVITGSPSSLRSEYATPSSRDEYTAFFMSKEKSASATEIDKFLNEFPVGRYTVKPAASTQQAPTPHDSYQCSHLVVPALPMSFYQQQRELQKVIKRLII